MLPHAYHLPPELSETSEIPLVPPSVRFYFHLPLHGELVLPEREAPAMPEIPVDEYRDFRRRKYNVRTASKSGYMGMKQETACGQRFHDDLLGTGILAADS